jgi:hypothetical protein
MARITQWNAEKLLRRVPLVLTNYGIKVTPLLQESIKATVYPWPVATQRKVGLYSGKFVPKGQRDIVDTGTLLRSQSAPQITANSLTITWGAPYSGEVLRGGFLVGTLRDAYIAPGRDWITPVLRTEEPMQFFVREWRKIGGA